jgi:hypothetical protein
MAIIEKDQPVRFFSGDTRQLTSSVLGELRKARALLVDQIASVDCKTFEEYRNRRGKIEGLDMAIDVCQKVMAKLEA